MGFNYHHFLSSFLSLLFIQFPQFQKLHLTVACVCMINYLNRKHTHFFDENFTCFIQIYL